jgi:hypothetical protein
LTVFTVRDRNFVRDRVLQIAASDPRVVAGAVVGSLALAEGDRWSDLDLTFAVGEGVEVPIVLGDWTTSIVTEFGATHLFDLPSGPSIYRVFLLPGCLQFDLSFTPASKFGAVGPKFRLLFGNAGERPPGKAQTEQELFGYAVHHAVRARICIERGRPWQAEYWISGARDYALSLACGRYGLSTSHGRGFDNLPPEVREPFISAFVTSLDRSTLQGTLCRVIEGLLREACEHQGLVTSARPMLLELMKMEADDSFDSAPPLPQIRSPGAKGPK